MHAVFAEDSSAIIVKNSELAFHDHILIASIKVEAKSGFKNKYGKIRGRLWKA